MSRPPSKLIVRREDFKLSGGAARERLFLECGHQLEQAPRPQRRKRAYCPRCPS